MNYFSNTAFLRTPENNYAKKFGLGNIMIILQFEALWWIGQPRGGAKVEAHEETEGEGLRGVREGHGNTVFQIFA